MASVEAIKAKAARDSKDSQRRKDLSERVDFLEREVTLLESKIDVITEILKTMTLLSKKLSSDVTSLGRALEIHNNILVELTKGK